MELIGKTGPMVHKLHFADKNTCKPGDNTMLMKPIAVCASGPSLTLEDLVSALAATNFEKGGEEAQAANQGDTHYQSRRL